MFNYRGFYYFVVGAYQSSCKGVFTLIEDLLAISESYYFVLMLYADDFVRYLIEDIFVKSESIYYLVFRLYGDEFVTFYHICFFLKVYYCFLNIVNDVLIYSPSTY